MNELMNHAQEGLARLEMRYQERIHRSLTKIKKQSSESEFDPQLDEDFAEVLYEGLRAGLSEGVEEEIRGSKSEIKERD
jgi:hypothetical protein